MGKRYDTYSKVNTNWVQELPTDWGFLPLQSQLKERKESTQKIVKLVRVILNK